MDGGNREDEDLRLDPGLAVASSPSSHPQTNHDLSTRLPPSRHQQYTRYDGQPLYADRFDPSLSKDDRRPPRPDSPSDPSATSYAADNVHAVASNAAVSAPGGNPDDFYRGYRNETAKHDLVPSPTHDPMASAASTSRRAPPARSISNSSSNATSTTPKPPALPGSRAGMRPIYRSASNPVDDRSPPNEGPRLRSANGSAVPPSARASVKDMKKRFEQGGTGTQSPAEAKRLASRNVARGGSARGVNGRSATVSSTQSYSSLRAAGGDSPKSGAPGGPQRSKFMPEDQVSTNSQSFASRINRPKPNSASNTRATKPASSLTKKASFPPSAPGGPLLFGEIRQENANAETPGYGIEDDPLQRVSDFPGQDPSILPQRSHSHSQAEPASPTDWYREVSSPQRNGRRTNDDGPTKSHGRSQSDLAGSKLPPLNTNPQLRRQLAPSPSPSPHSSSASRLPVLNKKLGTPSGPASPASSRSNSPAGTRRTAPGGRESRQQSTPAARAKTPVTRSKTPTGSSTPRRTPLQNSNNPRLAAVISPPPPKLSPQLRSSRPRQPVSQATTASSRLKAIDRSKSPHKPSFRPSARPESRQDPPPARRRKLSLGGPVDFAQRRETIKLKYSKSIRDTEARQAREAAAERRKKELEAAAKAKARAQARAQAQVAAAEEASALARAREPAKPSESPSDVEPQTESKAEATGDDTITVEDETAPDHVRAQPPALSLDSPTLGLPGTFPSLGSPPFDRDEAPMSAVSETSVITEFDNEAQTEPPVPEQSAHATPPEQPGPVVDTGDEDSAARQRSSAYKRATYRDPFEDIADEESIPITISLEPSSPKLAPPGPPAWTTSSAAEPLIPGAFTEDYDTVSVPEVEPHQPSEAQPDPQEEPDVQVEVAVDEPDIAPQTRVKDEYEPQPYVAQPYHTTTVTIISRDAGFGSPPYVEPEDADYMQPQHEPQMDLLEDFYTGPRLKDNIASLRDSTYTASDVDISDGPSGSGEAQRTPDTSNSLNVPSMTTPANRSSQQSIWTDLSYSSRESRRLDYLDQSEADESRPHSIRDDDDSFGRRYYMDGAEDEELHAERHEYRHTAESGTREPFAPYGPGLARSPSVPRLPDHSPPPPPEAGSRPTSGYFENHRPSSSVTRDDQESVSFPVSRRDSDDYHDASSPQSLGSGTAAPAPVDLERKVSEDADEESGPAKKAKSRLRQRQLCIKELVDTEAVFVRDMNVVEEIYKGTAEACPKLDDKTVKLIFRNTHEIIAFHTTFLSELKDGVTSVYVPRGRRSPVLKEDTTMSDAHTIRSVASTAASTVQSTAPSTATAVSLSGTTVNNDEADEARDHRTVIGPAFIKNIEQMRLAHEGFLRTSDVANKRLIEIQQDPTVQVWLNECNEVARDLTAAWNLDSLLIKPMQRITKYPNLIAQLLQYTPEDHPDREGLVAARITVENAILEINKTKKNFELVGQIVGRKRKESDVKAGFARAFGKRVDKLQASSHRPPEDPEYLKLNERFSDDYLRLQVVLRDVEFYTRQVTAYVQTFLDYLSAMELVMRLQPGPHPELEAKWVQFNVSMRDIKTVALDQHVSTAYNKRTQFQLTKTTALCNPQTCDRAI